MSSGCDAAAISLLRRTGRASHDGTVGTHWVRPTYKGATIETESWHEDTAAQGSSSGRKSTKEPLTHWAALANREGEAAWARR